MVIWEPKILPECQAGALLPGAKLEYYSGTRAEAPFFKVGKQAAQWTERGPGHEVYVNKSKAGFCQLVYLGLLPTMARADYERS